MTNLKSDSEAIVIVCAADNGYAMPLAVTVRSVMANIQTKRKIVLFIIDGGIRLGNKRKIIESLNSEQIKIEWVQPKRAIFAKMMVSLHVTIATYYRILIPELLPSNFKKAIYLDSDLIVKGDIEQLWNIDVEDNYLLAVQDIGAPYVSSHQGLMNYKQLGIPASYKYFNGGVLVFNLEKWRQDNISKQIIEYLEQNREYVRWWDQDGLNAILAGKWGELDLKWNQHPEIYDYSSWNDSEFKDKLKYVYNDIIHNPYIVHFATPGKPWMYSSCKHPEKNLFFQYVDKTAWSGWRLTFWRRVVGKIKRDMKPIVRFLKSGLTHKPYS